MPKTLATVTGIDVAALDRATAQLNAIKLIQLQCDLINEMRERFARSEQRELSRLADLRANAEKLGAYSVLDPSPANPFRGVAS